MLAYVFSHWSLADANDYEQLLRRFHESLRMQSPSGFHRSFVLCGEGAPWAASGGRYYEDWYLLQNSGMLDVLNDSAVSPPHRSSHDEVAKLAEGGAGALYKIDSSREIVKPMVSCWFSKPAGMSYSSLFELLSPVPNSSLWMRQMVLGPSPEFCLHLRKDLELPAVLKSRKIPVRRVYDGADLS